MHARAADEHVLNIFYRYPPRPRIPAETLIGTRHARECPERPEIQKDAPEVESVLILRGMNFISIKLLCFEFEFAVCIIDFEVLAFDQVAFNHFTGKWCLDVSCDKAFQRACTELRF